MCRIYQRMYSSAKNRSKGILGRFMDKVILRSFYSGSQSFEHIKRLGCRVKTSRHDTNILGCRVKASRHDDDINDKNINDANINDNNTNRVILRSFYSGSQSFEHIKRLGCRVKTSRHDTNILGCRVKASRHDDDINDKNINDANINDNNTNRVILRSFYSGSQSF